MRLKYFIFLAGAFLLMASLPAPSHGRQKANFDADWRFHLGPLAGSEVDNGSMIPRWRYLYLGKDKPADEAQAAIGVNTQDAGWKDAENGQDVFNNQPGWAWYRAELPDISGPHRILYFRGVDDNGTIYLNGQKLLHPIGWNDSFEVDLDKAWKEGGPNQLAVLVENTWGGGYIKETYLRTVGREEKTPPVATNDFNDTSWRSLHLPHDFVVEGTFDPKGDGSHGFLPKNVGWYRKTFEVPESAKGQILWIDFDGVFRDSRVWLNGKLLGHHLSGYTGFRYDITDTVNYGGKNVLTVYVDARDSEGWWYEGGGIYRHVWLTIADPLHVSPWGTYAVATPKSSGAALSLETTVDNQTGAAASFKLVSEVRDAKGKTVLKLSTPCTLAKGSTKAFTQKGRIAKAILWSLENPHLYTWTVSLQKGRQTVDAMDTNFGVRSFRFDANKGFFLNGKPVKIKGTCNHQDFAGVGIAIPDRIFTYRLEKLKEMGCNAYRCYHKPPPPGELVEFGPGGIQVQG